MLITIGFIVAFLRKTRVPPIRPRRLIRDGRVAGRLGARGAGCGTGGRAGAVLRVLPGALAPGGLRRGHRAGRGPRRGGHRAAEPLRSGPGRVTDRAGWVHANVNSFQRLLRPLTDKLGDRMGESVVSGVTRRFAGAEVGMLLGWMSTRVLGQYDLLVVEDPTDTAPDDQDLVYYVGPNVLALEKRFAFPPKEFRLWLALHEVTHRAQFTGVPWLREHYLGLVSQTLDSVDPDPKRFFDALTRVLDDLRHGRKPLDDGGLATLLASPAQREVLDKIGGLMSLLEGHGDITMDRAGADRIPSAHRFARVLRERRAPGHPPGQAAPAAPRDRGEDQPVRPRGGVHHRGRAPRRWARRARSGVAGGELVAHPRGDQATGGLARPRAPLRRARGVSVRSARHGSGAGGRRRT